MARAAGLEDNPTAAAQAVHRVGEFAMLFARMLFQTLAMILVLGLLLFLPARTLAWPGAWAFLGLMAALSLGVGAWLARADPGLLEERMKPLVQKDQKPWDKLLISIIGLGFLAWLAGMGFEVGRSGVQTPPWAQYVGAGLVAATFACTVLVFRENRFAAPVVKAQAGQEVISTGPYAVVRHPMYAGALPLFVGTPLMLGAPWGLLFLAVIVPVLALRIGIEERMLRQVLPGYGAYADQVRFRLLPGVW